MESAIIVLLLAEVEKQAWPRVLDTQTEFGYTALHWCAVYGGDDPDGRFAAVVDELVTAGASTSVVNSRGKTPWEVADPSSGVASVFQRYANAADPCMVVFYAAGNKQSQTTTQLVTVYLHPGLRLEKQRRPGRPDVAETFRDDLKLDHKRFTFWDIDPFSQWGDKMIDGTTKPFAEGGFGKIYLIKDVLAIEVAVQGKANLFRKVAIKVPKQFAQTIDDLKGEVVSLGGMAHPNVVQILGMVNGLVPDGGTAWSTCMALEWCETDLGRILYTSTDEGYEQYSIKLMVDLAEQTACGLVYIHGEGKAHLDLKPENVLVAKEGGRRVGKLADFGMAYTDDDDKRVSNAGAVPHEGDGSTHIPGSAKKIQDPQAPGDKAAFEDKIVPYGTWEYMTPEGWKRKYGKPSFESDIFSFGLMMWEMVAHKWIYSVFPGFFNAYSAPTVTENGKRTIVVKQIVERLAVKGQRPPAAWTGTDDLEHHGPGLLYKLMQACWVPEMADRPN